MRGQDGGRGTHVLRTYYVPGPVQGIYRGNFTEQITVGHLYLRQVHV